MLPSITITAVSGTESFLNLMVSRIGSITVQPVAVNILESLGALYSSYQCLD